MAGLFSDIGNDISSLLGTAGSIINPITNALSPITNALSPYTNQIGTMLGNGPTNSTGSTNNSQFVAGAAPLAQPISSNMAASAYGQGNAALTSQQQLAQALAAQNGMGNQNSVFGQAQGLANALGGNQGVANQASVFGQQQNLANALQNQANGVGPNPAQAALAQSTGENVSNQAALAAGQRGSAGNVGLMARQVGQQGAGIQQQAVGQAATLQAQQQLAAQQQLQAQQAQMAALSNTQIGQLQGQQGALGQLAGTQIAQQMAGQNAYNQAAQGQQNAALGQVNAQNTAINQQLGNVNTTNANLAGINANNANKNISGIVGGLTNAAGAAVAMLSKGGEVKGNPKLNRVPEKDRFPGHESLPPHMKMIASIYHPKSFGEKSRQAHQGYADGGDVTDMAALTQNQNPPQDDSEDSKDSGGGGAGIAGLAAMFAKSGGKVPGKAKMSGDHQANDTVPAVLSPGEVVIPKSVMESKDPVRGAAQFVAALQKNKAGPVHENDFKAALQRAISGRKRKS